MAKRENMSNRRGRLGVLLLTAALVCALLSGFAQAAPVEGGSATLEPAAPKPQITIQGNVVVSKGKPTGFYELALCVQTARTVTDNNTGLSAEAEYAALLAEAAETGDRTPVEEFLKTHTVTNYPFQSAAAAVHINLDALTAVTWGSGKPVYADWTGSYPSTTNSAYPRGIDRADPDQPKMFTDLQPILGGGARAVRLDTAKPDEVTNATALIEEAEFDAADAARRTALLTLSANTTTTANVVYEVPTPVVVVRFAYDMNRFTELEVGNPRDQVNAPNESDFWVGLDVNDRLPADAARTALTYLGAQDAGNPTDPYAVSDAQAAGSSVFQSVWYAQNMKSDGTGQEATHFYYYLGAEHCSPSGQASIQVYQEATGTDSSETLYVPKTAGSVVLADRNTAYATPGDPEAAAGGNPNYSFFQNLLQVRTDTLRLDLVNAETYRKPTGGGGITILFYDWDDSLIGSLIVDGGDVRSMVEEYVEENLVHPDLRPSTALKAMGGKLPDGGNYTTADQLAYQTLTNSLARDYTYRGKYAYTVGGDDATLGVTDGEDYPLTNKLDYVFTKRVNTSASYSVSDVTGTHTETYVLPHKVTDADMVDAALYPYAYGWAVVEDPSSKNQRDWKVMNDATKLEDTWTTIGVGELSNVEPDYYDNGAADQALPTALGAATYQAPAFLADEDPYWVDHVNEAPQPGMDYTNKYAYSLNSNGSESYFRFADFSDIDAELARYTKKNGTPKDTLIVKAVYEPGESLLDSGYYYRLIENPYYNKLNYYSAAQGGAYSVQVTLERSDTTFGGARGVARVRQPAVRQDTTYDQKWIQDNALGVDHNLDNATMKTAKALTETTFTKVDVENGDQVQFSLALSGRQNKINYFIVETYGYNFVAGGLRSGTNFDRVGNEYTLENYNYFLDGDSDTDDPYFDVKDYADRDGSHGFVLYGTLNNLMQYATLYNNREIDSDTYDLYVTFLILADTNIRDKNEQVASIVNETALKTALQNAARECQLNHKGDPDYWNDELQCAELTYHQLQWYIIDGTLRDRATADSEKLSFCHLHAACADLVSNKPKTWADVMEAAAQRDADRLKQLSFDELRNLTYLRNNANGGDFASRDVMINRLINAVNGDASLTDWVDVQRALLNGSGSVDTYFWYDGSTSNATPGSWNAMLERVTPAITPQSYPDGASRTTKAKLESLRSLFEANAAAGDNRATRQWINVTDNLVLAHREEQVEVEVNGETMKEWHYTYSPITDFETFKTSLVETVTAAQTGGFGAPSWEAVQYHLLFPGEALDFINEPWTHVKLLNTEGWDPDADPQATQWPEGFWWKGGNIPLTVDNVYTLLQAMEYLNGDDEDDQKRAEEALKAIDLARLEGQNFWLRKNKTGETWLERDETGAVTGPDAATQATLLAGLLKDIQAAQAAGANNWNTLQYYLIHKDDDPMPDVNDFTTVSTESYYYWWRQGGTGTSVTFPSGGSLNEAFPPLFEAAIRAGEFGDPLAKGSVEAQKVDGSFFALTRLTTSAKEHALDENTKLLTDLAWFTDTDALLTKMKELMTFMQGKQGITDPYLPPDRVTWYQGQHWLLTGEYIQYGEDAYTKAMEDYWWYDKDERPAPPPAGYTDEELAADAALMVDVNNQLTAGAVKKLSQTKLNKLGLEIHYKSYGVPTRDDLLNIMGYLVTEDLSPYTEGGNVCLTWAQLEYYVESAAKKSKNKFNKNGTLLSPSDAVAGLVNDFGWSTSNFPAGAINRTL